MAETEKQRRDHTKLPTKIMKCECDHEFQDNRYGKKMRVFNPAKDDRWRCTVCDRTLVA